MVKAKDLKSFGKRGTGVQNEDSEKENLPKLRKGIYAKMVGGDTGKISSGKNAGTGKKFGGVKMKKQKTKNLKKSGKEKSKVSNK